MTNIKRKGSNQHKNKYKLNWLRRLVWVSIGLFIVWALFVGYTESHPNIQFKVVDREVITDTLTEKIDELRGNIVADIKQGESLGRADCDGMITYDPNINNKKVEAASLGCYQYKVKTVQYYYKKLYNVDLTRKEAILVALDTDKAGKLTYDIVFTVKGGYREWLNTSIKYNIGNQVALLDSLTK